MNSWVNLRNPWRLPCRSYYRAVSLRPNDPWRQELGKDFIAFSEPSHRALVEDQDLIHHRQNIGLMRDQNDRPVFRLEAPQGVEQGLLPI